MDPSRIKKSDFVESITIDGTEICYRIDRMIVKVKDNEEAHVENGQKVSFQTRCQQICNDIPYGEIIRMNSRSRLVYYKIPIGTDLSKLLHKISRRGDVEHTDYAIVDNASTIYSK